MVSAPSKSNNKSSKSSEKICSCEIIREFLELRDWRVYMELWDWREREGGRFQGWRLRSVPGAKEEDEDESRQVRWNQKLEQKKRNDNAWGGSKGPNSKGGLTQTSKEGSKGGSDLVNFPTRWSLLFLIGYLCRSSSWRWWRHIRGCRLLRTSLRAGMRFLAHFFCKMYFLYVCTWRKIW